jgi:uncharacterized Ntn-hydrolase superfamily protein
MLYGTFSITARSLRTGELGVAVASKYLAVGAAVPFVAAGVGAVATQARVNSAYGPQALSMLKQGLSPQDILQQFAGNDPEWEFRQLHLIDAKSRVACHTGAKTVEWAGHLVGVDSTVAGNILTGPEVLEAMLQAFHADPAQPLARRLLAALLAGDEAGGDRRGKHSAAVLVARTELYPIVNLRVDDHPDAPRELARLLDLFAKAFPQHLG